MILSTFPIIIAEHAQMTLAVPAPKNPKLRGIANMTMMWPSQCHCHVIRSRGAYKSGTGAMVTAHTAITGAGCRHISQYSGRRQAGRSGCLRLTALIVDYVTGRGAGGENCSTVQVDRFSRGVHVGWYFSLFQPDSSGGLFISDADGNKT